MIPHGSVLAERYQIVRLIARGGMGEVYEAHDLAREKRIALKTLTPCDDQSDAAQQLRAEVELAHRVTHKYVCRTFDLGVHRGDSDAQVLFITMELVNGRSLTQCLRASGALAPADACRVGLRTLEGLEAAHDAGVLHRDLKSDNVMLRDSEDGELIPVIMDFGLSKTLTTSSTSGSGEQALAGTLAYLAPEQLQGKGPRVTTDLYAFGLVMFEMLTAKLPFAGATPALEALKRLQEPAPSVLQFNPAVSLELAQFVARCLDREPSKRFPSARVASEHLRLVPELVDVAYRPTLGVIKHSDLSDTQGTPGAVTDSAVTNSASTRSRRASAGFWGLSLLALAGVTLVIMAVAWKSTPARIQAPGQVAYSAQSVAAERVNHEIAPLVTSSVPHGPSPSVSQAAPTSAAAPRAPDNATVIVARSAAPSPPRIQARSAALGESPLAAKGSPQTTRPTVDAPRSTTPSDIHQLDTAAPLDPLPEPAVQRTLRRCPPGMLCPGIPPVN